MKKSTVGTRLLKLRTDAGLTQEQLVKKLGNKPGKNKGWTRQRLLQLEHPDNDNIRIPLARKLAKALNVPFSAVVVDVA